MLDERKRGEERRGEERIGEERLLRGFISQKCKERTHNGIHSPRLAFQDRI